MEIPKDYNRIFQGYHFEGAEPWSCGTLLSKENDTGTGSMRCYEVFPGALLVYNEFHMASGYQKVEPVEGFLQINHCRRGCYELKDESGWLCYLGEGDLAVSDPEVTRIVDSRFPIGRYEGISVMLEIAPADQWLKEHVSWAGLDLFSIKEKIGHYEEPLLLRMNSSVEHIFEELYQVKEAVRSPLSVLKVVELLLFLSLEAGEPKRPLPHFSQAVAKSTQEVHAYLSSHPLTNLTLPELSAKFHISETSLKSCFKAIYGHTLGAFLRKERIQTGAALLRESPEMTIGEIALKSGYENPSKFAKAFKACMGVSPKEYRLKVEHVYLESKKDGLE